ncbi:MAG: hypothetical protein Q9219_007015 [cf. Caloplaca sp. 3 TL-2023]
MGRDDTPDLNPSSVYSSLRSLIGIYSFGGQGLYFLRTMAIGSTVGAIAGMMSAVCGGLLFGCGSLFFVIGASVGFAGGVWKHYSHSLMHASVAVEDYPTLMMLHLDANFPFHRWKKRGLTRLGWVERSMLVTAWQSAGAAVEVSCAVDVV